MLQQVDDHVLRAGITGRIEDAREELIALSRSVHSDPELAFQEHRSSDRLCEMLTRHGFDLHRGVAGLPTAFDAQFGDGAMHVAVLAEYDALPELGHACGHNIIAAAAVGAGIALAPFAADLDITVHVIGTPAEESGGGKAVMLSAGVFDDIAAVAMVHPGPSDRVTPRSLAIAELEVAFAGRAAHAAAAPELGVNAADAVTVSQVAIGLLRQHLAVDDLVHGIVTAGGSAPNVIPDHASLHYLLRASSSERLARLMERLTACFEAGALATGARCHITEIPPRYLALDADPILADACDAEFHRLGRHDRPSDAPLGSTDMGNLTAVLPGIHPMLAVGDGTANLHQAEFAELCAGPAGDLAVVDGARILAGTLATVTATPASRAHLLAVLARRRAHPPHSATPGAQHMSSPNT